MEHTLVLKQWRDENTRILFTGNCDQYKNSFPAFFCSMLYYLKKFYMQLMQGFVMVLKIDMHKMYMYNRP